MQKWFVRTATWEEEPGSHVALMRCTGMPSPSESSIRSRTTREATSPRAPRVRATQSLRPETRSCCSSCGLKATATTSNPTDALHTERSPARSDAAAAPAVPLAAAAAAAAARSAAAAAAPLAPLAALLAEDFGSDERAGCVSRMWILSASARARKPLEDAVRMERTSPPVPSSVRSSRACGPSLFCLRSKAPARTEWRRARMSVAEPTVLVGVKRSTSPGSASRGTALCTSPSTHSYTLKSAST